MAFKVVTGGGGPLSAPGHKVVDTLGPFTGVQKRSDAAISTLAEWWGIIDSQGGAAGSPSVYTPPDLTNVPGPNALLPVAYGSVRVPGAMIYIDGFNGDTRGPGRGIIAWCQGEIASIDAIQPWFSAQSNDYWTRTIDNHMGEPGGDTNPWNVILGSIFSGPQPGLAACAYTYWTITTSPYYFYRWWQYLPGGYDVTGSSGAANAVAWTADIHGLLLYDPRTATTGYSNNPALIARDLLSRFGLVPDALLDDVSFSAAADACDYQGFACNVVFASSTLLSDALAIVLQTCNGTTIDSNGKTGIFLDVPNADPPVATLSEEDGDTWGITYSWISSRSRYTRIAVSFMNSASNYAQDQTPNLDDPGIAAGTVPINAQVVNAPGINTLAAAVVLRDFLFNSQMNSFRLTGTMNAKGLSLQQGQKVHIDTLKGVNADFLILQIASDNQGFSTYTAQPYDVEVYGSAPLTQPPPIVTTPPVDPTTAGNDITVTDATGTRQTTASNSSNQTVYDLFQLIKYTLPTTGTPLKELRVRGFAGTGAGTKTWTDMAASEIVVLLTGNEPPPDATHSMLSMPSVVKTVRTLTFAPDGQLITTADATGPTRIIIKTATLADVLSTGVTVDVTASTATTTNPRTDVPLWKWVKSTTAANGSTKVFAIPTKPVAGCLMVFADGELLVDSTFSPVQGADYSLSGLNVTIDSARAAPINYVAFMYQESVE
jgi:hypothetical protein